MLTCMDIVHCCLLNLVMTLSSIHYLKMLGSEDIKLIIIIIIPSTCIRGRDIVIASLVCVCVCLCVCVSVCVSPLNS